jgi:hypothetical protein
MVKEKIFIVISNMYFFNQSRGMKVDFNVIFHPVPMLDFAYVFPNTTTTAQTWGISC